MKRVLTASVATLGCKLNQSESDQISRQLRRAGVTLVPFGGAADLHIINSCTVTHVGDRKSRHLVRQAVRSNPESFVAVVGCYAETDPAAVAAIEGVGAVLGNRSKDDLLSSLRSFGLEFPGETDIDANAAPGLSPGHPGRYPHPGLREGAGGVRQFLLILHRPHRPGPPAQQARRRGYRRNPVPRFRGIPGGGAHRRQHHGLRPRPRSPRGPGDGPGPGVADAVGAHPGGDRCPPDPALLPAARGLEQRLLPAVGLGPGVPAPPFLPAERVRLGSQADAQALQWGPLQAGGGRGAPCPGRCGHDHGRDRGLPG